MATDFDTKDSIVFDGDIAWAKNDFNPLIDRINDGFLQVEADTNFLFSGGSYETTCREILYGNPVGQLYSCKDISDMVHVMVCFYGHGVILNGATDTNYPSIRRMHKVAVEYNDTAYQIVHDHITDAVDGPSVSACIDISNMVTNGARDGSIIPSLQDMSGNNTYSLNAFYLEAHDITYEVQDNVLGYNGTLSGKMSVEKIIELLGG